MHLPHKFLRNIYKYIYIHSGQTILIKDICEATGYSKPTVIKYIRWLMERDIIKKSGKHFEVSPL